MRITGRSMASLAAIAAILVGVACGGGSGGSSNPSTPTPPGTGGGTSGRCRTYPTVAGVTTTAAGITQNANLTGAFNSSTDQATITISFAGGGLCSTAVHSYRSVADFVDEVRVVPPVPLVLSTTTTNSGSCGSGTATATNTYDAQRRLMQISSVGGTITYTAWDTSNRHHGHGRYDHERVQRAGEDDHADSSQRRRDDGDDDVVRQQRRADQGRGDHQRCCRHDDDVQQHGDGPSLFVDPRTAHPQNFATSATRTARGDP